MNTPVASSPPRPPGLTRLAAVLSGLALLTGSARGADPIATADPTVPLAFNRIYDEPALAAALQAIAKGHPNLVAVRSIGKSVEGRDLWCATVTGPKNGPDTVKPAMYVDGNIHGNEVQGSEACLYLVWYLAENYGKVDRITTLLDERTFYVLPTVNPDGRAWWFAGPNTTHSSRGGKSPVDEDRDGKADEDGPDDLDGDGHIVAMRRADPNGRWKVDPDDPMRLIPAESDEAGGYELLGLEGIDNDGDGRVNEDGPGGYDMNRNWPADWQPEHEQRGAGPYPLCWPETRAVADFIRSHPNIAGVQAFHNYGGMILRGPGHPSRQSEYPDADERVAAAIGAAGERMLPFYKSMIIHRDLYSVHGGFIGWTYEHLGIISFTNELYNEGQLLGQPEAAGRPGPAPSGREADRGRRRLTADAEVVPWHAVEHPLYGKIEVGGDVKQWGRVPPSFLLEELCHRNAAFVIHHADQMPRVEWHAVEVRKLGPDTYAVTAAVRNTRPIPTRTAQAARRKLGRADELAIEGDGLVVIAAGRLEDRYTGAMEPVEATPARLRLESGVNTDPVFVRWIVRGKGKVTLSYRAEKATPLTREVTLD